MEQEIIYRQEIGKRTMAGTNWPVENIIYRQKIGSRIFWYAVKGLCNGIPLAGKTFKTNKEAAIWIETPTSSFETKEE